MTDERREGGGQCTTHRERQVGARSKRRVGWLPQAEKMAASFADLLEKGGS
jgi:hypothetical protein